MHLMLGLFFFKQPVQACLDNVFVAGESVLDVCFEMFFCTYEMGSVCVWDPCSLFIDFLSIFCNCNRFLCLFWQQSESVV